MAYEEENQTYYPPLTAPKHLYVAAIWNNGSAIGMPSNVDAYHRTVVVLGSLAGLLLKHGHTNGVYIEANADHQLILRQLAPRRGITYQYVANPQTPWNIVDRFKSVFGNRYVRYDLTANPDSLNVARMASYKFDAIMVDQTLESTAIARGLTNVFDCSDKDDQWIYDNWLPTWERKDVAVEQVNLTSMAQYRCLDDYATAVGAVAFYDGASTPLRQAFLRALEDDSPVIGWGDFNEIDMTAEMSLRSTFLNAANYCYNLAILSSLRDRSNLPLQQKTHSVPTTETNVHYLTFVWTDGDNIQWFHNGFLTSAQWYGSSQRGSVPIGWGVSPSMRDLGQTILEQLYDSAKSTNTGSDFFVAMSPPGYCYPSMLSSEARQRNAQRLNRYMAEIDTRIVIFIDNAGFDQPEAYGPYLDQPDIDAILYWDVLGDYAKYRGAVKWINGKPIISARVWMRNLGQLVGPQQVANDVNTRPRNPQSVDGYSVVPVHAWSMSVSQIVQCVSLLDPAVRVVTPEELVFLMKTNLAPQLPSFTAQPNSQVVPPGGSINLQASATGAAPLGYQWYLNGNPMTGYTSPTLSISSAVWANSGTYHVVLSNQVGTVASRPAIVTVQPSGAFSSNCVSVPSGLVNWWSTDGNAVDSIGQNNGSPQNGVIFATGRVGSAFSFDGANDYVAIPFSRGLGFPPTGEFTLMAWVRPQPGGAFQAIAVKCPPSGEWDWGLWIDTGNRFMAGLHNQHILTSATTAQPGIWRHVAMTYSNRNWSLFVDGIIEAQATSALITESTGGLAFGRKGESASNPSWFQGLIDEGMIFDRTLSEDEIHTIYLSGGDGLCKRIEFVNVGPFEGNGIRFDLVGPVAMDYELLGSTELGSWAPIVILTNTTGVVEYSDRGSTNHTYRFFRAVIP